jgi:predicted dehydrogenase
MSGLRPTTVATRPRLGFLGVGWIGRSRLDAIARSGLGKITAIADASDEALRATSADYGAAASAHDLDELLAMGVDAVVIATPSALHVQQVRRALAAGAAVFCQKPLGLNAREASEAVAAACDANLLLGVDMSYRQLAATAAIDRLLSEGALGEVFAMELVFHNAYGPDKPWFYDYALSGGGCLIDLGTHLVDLALRFGRADRARVKTARRLAAGRTLGPGEPVVEDYAALELELSSGVPATVACSWHLHAGRDAVIDIQLHGTRGGACIRNVGGSFYNFEALLFQGTTDKVLVRPPDDWFGRAGVEWLRSLVAGARFDPEVEQLVTVAEIIDEAYGR